jgi:hypothetical protein
MTPQIFSRQILDRRNPSPLKIGLFAILWLAFLPSPINGQTRNGFDVGNATIPLREIRGGGPPRDGIPAIDDPRFLEPSRVDFLAPEDELLSVTHAGITRAYPLRILVWHEVVNDTLGELPVAVTYCPLCHTAMVFKRTVDGKPTTFGVSGLLYQSDVLMYDRATESLWSQLRMQAVAGPRVGDKLEWLPSAQMTWQAWKQRFPQGQVLSMETGHQRPYRSEAYARYHAKPDTLFPVPRHREDLPRKALVYGVIVNNQPAALSVSQLDHAAKNGPITFARQFDDQAVQFTWDPDARHLRARSGTDEDQPIPVVKVYWFAWQAFYPRTELLEPSA